jgi:hypothetical protein
MSRDIKYRIRLKAIGKGTGYEVGEVVTIFNDIFNKQNGVAFFQLNHDWEVLSSDQFTGLKDNTGKDIYEDSFTMGMPTVIIILAIQ